MKKITCHLVPELEHFSYLTGEKESPQDKLFKALKNGAYISAKNICSE